MQIIGVVEPRRILVVFPKIVINRGLCSGSYQAMHQCNPMVRLLSP